MRITDKSEKIINEYLIFILILLTFFSNNGNFFNNSLKFLSYILVLAFFCVKGHCFNFNDKKSAILNTIVFLVFIVLLFFSFINENSIKWLNIFFQVNCFLIIIYYYNGYGFDLNHIMCFFMIVGLVIQTASNRTYDMRSYLNALGDSNYSAYYIFLWVILCDLSRRRLTAVTLGILGSFTLSRNYFISIILYLIISRFQQIYKFLLYIFNKFKINFFVIAIFSVVCALVIGDIFISKASLKIIANSSDYHSMMGRMMNIYDTSNVARFRINNIFLDQLFEYPQKYLWGYNDQLYKRTVANTPHNAVLLGILKYGLSFFAYFYFMCKGITNKILQKNLQVIIPIIVYMMILGLGINGMDVLLLAIILKLNYREVDGELQ